MRPQLYLPSRHDCVGRPARVFWLPVNLGIAGNYRRAKNYIFEVLVCQSALLLEDDLVLGFII